MQHANEHHAFNRLSHEPLEMHTTAKWAPILEMGALIDIRLCTARQSKLIAIGDDRQTDTLRLRQVRHGMNGE